MLKTCLFDLDGTLTDPKEGITKAVAYALTKFKIEVASLDDLELFIGPPLLDSFMEYYDMSKKDANQAIIYYREYFRERGIFENVLYACIKSLLQTLKRLNITCIIATSKPEEFANRIVEHFHLNTYFSDVCGASMDGMRSKKGDVIAYALKKHHLSHTETIMIGDRKYDILGAKEHHLISIGVLYGYGSRDELEHAKADYIVENVKELQECIQSIRK